MKDQQPGKWDRLPKMNFSAKDLSRRMKKVETATVRHARKFVFRRIDNAREVRRHIAIWVLMVGYIIAATALQLSWYQQNYKTVAAGPGGTYAEAVLGPLDTLNPLFKNSSAEESASRLLFSSLMYYDTTGHLNYDLASSVKIDKTKKVYTVTLRSDASWHDNLPVTAHDVAFTVDLIKNPLTRSTTSGWEGIGVKVIDNKTVSFTLPSTYAAFPHALNFPVLPEHLLKDVDSESLRENAFSSKPVGSGPFAFRLLQSVDEAGSRKVLHVIRNENYYRGVPKLERVQLTVFDSKQAILDALGTYEVNAAVDISVSDIDKVPSSRYMVERMPINAGVYALFNTTSPILKDKSVRQAIQKGTDTTILRQTLGEGTPELYLPFVAGQVQGNLPDAPEVDIDGAKAQLEKAGWKLSGEQTVRQKADRSLSLNVVTIKDSDYEKVLENLIGQWRTLGIGVTTTILDPTVNTNIAQTVLVPRQYDILIYQLVIGADPDVYAYWHSSQAQPNEHGFNLSNYNSELGDDALVSARSVLDPALRNAKYSTFARQWLADAPAIGLYQSTMQYVSGRSNRTLLTSSSVVLAIDRYADISNWSVEDRNVFTTP